MKENQLFTRYEFKYLISNKIAGEIFNQSLNFMKLDEFALENKAYDVRSLYYDNYDFDNFFEKVDGIKFRKKFRIRTYGKKFQKFNPIYLEAKGRVQDRIFKKRNPDSNARISLSFLCYLLVQLNLLLHSSLIFQCHLDEIYS